VVTSSSRQFGKHFSFFIYVIRFSIAPNFSQEVFHVPGLTAWREPRSLCVTASVPRFEKKKNESKAVIVQVC
jgi:hypothetical protein